MKKDYYLYLCFATALTVVIFVWSATYAKIETKAELHETSIFDIKKINVQMLKNINLISSRTRFLYCTQTESCLPPTLSAVEVLGNTSACHCDVLVLSYKQACQNQTLPHVQYLFNSSTTWTTGRNVLYEEAMKSDTQYLYYIFMDDDIQLVDSTGMYPNPWRGFENFLIDVEPAVGTVMFDVESMYYSMSHLRKCKKNLGCPLNDSSLWTPVVAFDAAFNAFHLKSVDYILPYTEEFDYLSMWLSQVSTIIKCEVMFRGGVITHTVIDAVNPKHRPYTRGHMDEHSIAAVVASVEASLPKEYKNASVIMNWKKKPDFIYQRSTSSTLCLKPL